VEIENERIEERKMNGELKKIIDNSQNIVFFGGAGVSTESGIPDFRSEDGLYQAQQKYGRSPEEMLSHTFFIRDSETFYDYYKNNLIHKNAQPNKAHKSLAKLEEMGKLSAIVTQNIDGLHQLAGSKNVYELHGSVLRNNCTDCNTFYDVDYILEQEKVPLCQKCQGVIKPDVVLYEEALDDQVLRGAIKAISEADTLIVGGTSLVVYPAAGLINYFKGKNLVLINKSVTPYDNKAHLVIHDSIGEVLSF
jgi:NAD-dependent deacetylase